MIKQEFYEVEGMTLIKTYSGSGFLIRQDETGDLYGEAIDPATAGRTYTETDIPVDAGEPDEPEEPESPDASDYASSIAALEDAMCELEETMDERIAAIEDALCELDREE